MEKIIFHLGTPKTGTSIIQSHLAQNRSILRDNGFFYPTTISSDRNLYKTFESHHLLTYAVAGWEPFNRYNPNDFMRRCEKTCNEYSLKTVLLSAENTYWLPRQIVARDKPEAGMFWDEKKQYMQKFRDLFRSSEIKIVIYLRRQDHWLESWYNQQIKNGNRLPDNVFEFGNHCEYLLDYKRYLAILSEIFGNENILVRVYEKEQLENGLFADFAEIVGIGDPEKYPLYQPARYNSQLEPAALKFMHLCNSINASPDVKRRLRLIIRSVTKQFESQIVFKQQDLLPSEQRERLLDKYRPDNNDIACDYLKRSDGILFKESENFSDNDENASEENQELHPDDIVKLIMGIVLAEMESQTISERKKSFDYLWEKSKVAIENIYQPLANQFRKRSDDRIWEELLWKYEKF